MKAKNTLIERATAIIIFKNAEYLETGFTSYEIAMKERIEKRLNDYLHSKKFIKEIYTDYGRELVKFDL